MRAHIRFLPRVSSDVDDELAVLGETLFTVRALVGTFTGVNSHMGVAVPFRGESLSTEGTRERTFPRVSLVVGVEAGPTVELPSAHVALELVGLRLHLKRKQIK